MHQIIFYIILFLNNLTSLSSIADRNSWKQEASRAYVQKNYKKALFFYKKLTDGALIVEPSVRMNLANTYFLLSDTINAKEEYRKILRISDKELVSQAQVQLGVLNVMNKDSVLALQLFKEALQKNPSNQVARFNYELLKKKLPPNPPLPPPNNQQQEQQEQMASGMIVKSDDKDEELESQKPENMSREKALQVLESMKSNEIQYVRKKKGNGSKESKKDW